MNIAPSDIRRVAVLGAGTMGAQIAALIASCGVKCDLLDLSVDMVEEARATTYDDAAPGRG